MAELIDELIELSIPIRGRKVNIKVKRFANMPRDVAKDGTVIWEGDRNEPRNVANLMEFWDLIKIYPELGNEIIQDSIKSQADQSVLEYIGGTVGAIGSGASLGWGEEIASYMTALPTLAFEMISPSSPTDGIVGRLKQAGSEYVYERDRQVEEIRADQEYYQHVNPNSAALAKGTGTALLAATGLGASPAMTGAAATMGTVLNPMAIAAPTLSRAVIESITKGAAIAGTDTVGNAEGLLSERIKRAPPAMQEGAEWAAAANIVLGIGGAALKLGGHLASKVATLRGLGMGGMDFVKAVARKDPDALAKITAEAEAAGRGSARKTIHDLIDIDGGPSNIVASAEDAAARGTQQTLGEMGGPRLAGTQIHSAQANIGDHLSLQGQFASRAAGEPQRVGAAVRGGLGVAEATTEGLLGNRQRRVEGTEDNLLHTGVPVESPGFLGAQPLGKGTATVRYDEAYKAPDVPSNVLKGDSIMWKRLYRPMIETRQNSINNPKGGVDPYDAQGVSMQLPGSFSDFVKGVRYIPKTTWTNRKPAGYERVEEVKLKHPRSDGTEYRLAKKGEKGKLQTQDVKDKDGNTQQHWRIRKIGGNVSVADLHSMRKALDTHIKSERALGNDLDGLDGIRRQIDEDVKGHIPQTTERAIAGAKGRLVTAARRVDDAPSDMSVADAQIASLKTAETTAAAGRGLLKSDKSASQTARDAAAIAAEPGTLPIRAYKTGVAESLETAGATALQIVDDLPLQARLKAVFEGVPGGEAQFNKALAEIQTSADMATQRGKLPDPTSMALAGVRKESPSAYAFRMFAKVPAYAFSKLFAGARDLAEKAKELEKAVSSQEAAEITRILRTTGDEAIEAARVFAATKDAGTEAALNKFITGVNQFSKIAALTHVDDEQLEISPALVPHREKDRRHPLGDLIGLIPPAARGAAHVGGLLGQGMDAVIK
jgi:hypothetical protein